MNVAKFGAAGVTKMLGHYTRGKDENGEYLTYPHSEGGAGHIRRERTEDNYTIGECHDEEWISERLSGVYQKPGQKDPVKMCDIVLTLPKSEDPANARQFFEAGYRALCAHYGLHDNVVGAWVHMDEAQPHMHFAFLPISPRQSRQKPQFKEKLSTRAYWPKKSSLQEMHRTMQKELDEALGRHVEVTFERSKDRDAYNRLGLNELKAMTEKMENGRTDKAKAAAVRKERGGTLRRKEVFYEVPETAFAILASQSRAAEMAKDEERKTAKREKDALERAEKAEKEKKAAEERMTEVMRQTAAFMDAPEYARQDFENARQEALLFQRDMQRDCIRVFLSSGRDFRAACEKMRPTLEEFGITDSASQRDFVKKSLACADRQLRREYRVTKDGRVTSRKKDVPAQHDGSTGAGGGPGHSWEAPHGDTDYLHNAGAVVSAPGRLDEGHEEIGPWSMLSKMAQQDEDMKKFLQEVFG